jgi:membrane-bound lytic murein transglycosylase D
MRPLTPLPVALTLLLCAWLPEGSARDSIDAEMMKRPPELAPAVAFWREIFGRYSKHEVVIHARDYPNKIFTVLDYRAEAAGNMNAAALARKRRQETKAAIARIDAILEQLDAAGGDPSGLGDEARAVAELFADIDDPEIFGKVAGRVRAQQGVRERTRAGLERAGRYLPHMEAVFSEHELPLALTRLPLVESSFDSGAYSKVGAAGVWQFIPSSARRYMRLDHLVDDRRDPWASTEAAARHLRDDFEALGDWPLAVTAYNFGRYGVRRALEETGHDSLGGLLRDYDSPRFGFASRNFYASFLAALDVEQQPEKWFGQAVDRMPPARFDTVETRDYVAWSTLQRLSGWDAAAFARHNPAYDELVRADELLVPPGHRIRVAPGESAAFLTAYAQLGDAQLHDAQREAFLRHRVARGETLSEIARRFGTSAAHLQRLNGLRSVHHLRAGQSLRIPAPGGVGGTRTASANKGEHRVRSGETLSEIARRFGISAAALQRLNGLQDADRLRAGQILRVPGSSGATHVVNRGDTLSGIAARYGSSVPAIAAANGMDAGDLLRPGAELRIPGATGPRRHRVARGETLWDIARQHGTSIASIAAHNALDEQSLIRPGLTLEIP